MWLVMMEGRRSWASLFAPLVFFVELLPSQCSAMFNITPSTPLLKIDTLSSPGDIFELGFFSPNDSENEFLGIWYKGSSPKRVVWVANRERPLKASNASLVLGTDGNLTISVGERNIVWSSNRSFRGNRSIAELSDRGNLVLKDVITGDLFWESFNHPGDTFLLGMKLMANGKTGEKRVLTSWKSASDPSPGDVVVGLIPRVPPESFIWKNSKLHWRSGPWSKQKFIGIEDMDSLYTSVFNLDQDVEGETATFFITVYSNGPFKYMRISPEGSLSIMLNEGKEWSVSWEEPKNPCDFCGACGPFGICSKHKKPTCKCLEGFIRKSELESAKGNWTTGCERQKELNCVKKIGTESKAGNKVDKFVPVARVKLPYFYQYDFTSVDPDECQRTCLSNCSCSAYAFVQGIGCLIWMRELIDTVEFSSTGETLFLRVADTKSDGDQKLVISLVAVSAAILLGIIMFGYFKWTAKRQDTTEEDNKTILEDVWRSNALEDQDPSDLPLFDFGTILSATNNFSMRNKLGHGGFGQVYKGKLPDGRDIAVKRLSSNSGQGVEEFKNEAVLISKLQHRNLVRILGCCIGKEEKLLIYEFMVNRSLDTFLFDPKRKLELDWPSRFNIIHGIARGLLYLHCDSCLRVIHRDLKASNILLDEKMNPKISDFGLARIFQGTQDLANTHRVVGTLGYMSPEYAFNGIFSEKSDVFSFGVLLLEIITGRRINNFMDDELQECLTAYAWRSWCQGLKIWDKKLGDSVDSLQATRFVHIALLCVQDQASDRPTMLQVVSALNSEVELPRPKQPVYVFQNVLNTNNLSHSEICTANEVTITTMVGR